MKPIHNIEKGKPMTSEVTQKDIEFAKTVAKDFGLSISDEDAKRAVLFAIKNHTEDDFYQALEEFFIN